MPSFIHSLAVLAVLTNPQSIVGTAQAAAPEAADQSPIPLSHDVPPRTSYPYTGQRRQRSLQAACDSTCACDSERAQDCGATNPDRPQSCCEGYVCAGGSSKRCVSATNDDGVGENSSSPNPTTTKPTAQCGIDATPANAKCEDGMCCSSDGICGYTIECGLGCQSGPCDDVPGAETSDTIPTPDEYQPLSSTPPSVVDTDKLSEIDAETYDLLTGCGPHVNTQAPLQYASVMLDMHRTMAINYTGNDETDFLAGMIPHHRAAVDMCAVYHHAAKDAGTGNDGIDSLCYNITYGPVDAMGYGNQWQADFSQVGETEQMMDILRQLDMVEHYERGCGRLGEEEKRDLAIEADEAIRGGTDYPNMDGDNSLITTGEQRGTDPSHPAAAWWDAMTHKSMFMGCGRLDLPSTKDYLAAGMKMHMRMAFEWTGDPAVDFLLGMLPHHEGAIEMCDIYYKYWNCAPSRTVCYNPLPLDEIQRLISNHEAVSTLNAMHHICAGHILLTQPKEVQWMKLELGKLNPQALAEYEDQTDENGNFLIDKIPCAEKYIEIQSSTGEVIASGGESNNEENNEPDGDDEQCSGHGEKARACGAKSHKWSKNCCEGLRCADKLCIDPDIGDDVDIVVADPTEAQDGADTSATDTGRFVSKGGTVAGIALILLDFLVDF